MVWGQGHDGGRNSSYCKGPDTKDLMILRTIVLKSLGIPMSNCGPNRGPILFGTTMAENCLTIISR